MAQPALKLNEYWERLNTPSSPPSELELRRMLIELERATKTLSGPELAYTYSLIGMAHASLGKLDRALTEFKKSARLHPTLTHKFNLGKLHLRLGQLEEAVDVLAEAVEIDGRDSSCLAFFAEALFRLGSVEDAREVFEQAISVTDFTNPLNILGLAARAAVITADAEAVELYARFLALLQGTTLGDQSAVAFIEQSDGELNNKAFAHAPALKRAIERAILFGPGVEHLRMMPLRAEPPPAGPSETDETAADVLAWMGPHRARANAAVLPEGEEDE